MRQAVLTAAFCTLLSSLAPAQVAPSAPPPNAPPGSSAPEPGANSFTEAQARSRLETMGYSSVSELRKDDQGIWRGRAVYGGQQVTVSTTAAPAPANERRGADGSDDNQVLRNL